MTARRRRTHRWGTDGRCVLAAEAEPLERVIAWNRRGPRAAPVEAPTCRASTVGSAVERRAGLEQGLEAAEHPAPAAAGTLGLAPACDHVSQLGCTRDVVGDGEAGDVVVGRVDLVAQVGETFLLPPRGPEEAPPPGGLSRRG